uniref:Mucin-5AC n=1 Tax=Steinernema glaseri TaxID=37863 RepID=A0A1I7YNH8_9BILA
MPRFTDATVPTSRLVVRFHVRLKKRNRSTDSDANVSIRSSLTTSTGRQKPKRKYETIKVDGENRQRLRKQCLEDHRKIMETIEASENFLRRAKDLHGVKISNERESRSSDSSRRAPRSQSMSAEDDLSFASLVTSKRPRRKKALTSDTKSSEKLSKRIVPTATTDHAQKKGKQNSAVVVPGPPRIISDPKDPSKNRREYYAAPWNLSHASNENVTKKSANLCKDKQAHGKKTVTESGSNIDGPASSCSTCCCCCPATPCCYRKAGGSVCSVLSKKSLVTTESANNAARVNNATRPDLSSSVPSLSTLSANSDSCFKKSDSKPIQSSPAFWASFHKSGRVLARTSKMNSDLCETTQTTQPETSIELNSPPSPGVKSRSSSSSSKTSTSGLTSSSATSGSLATTGTPAGSSYSSSTSSGYTSDSSRSTASTSSTSSTGTSTTGSSTGASSTTTGRTRSSSTSETSKGNPSIVPIKPISPAEKQELSSLSVATAATINGNHILPSAVSTALLPGDAPKKI